MPQEEKYQKRRVFKRGHGSVLNGLSLVGPRPATQLSLRVETLCDPASQLVTDCRFDNIIIYVIIARLWHAICCSVSVCRFSKTQRHHLHATKGGLRKKCDVGPRCR
ncbi:hypothetical protein CEXT_657961 [Caerostris extrusa]|uniref:Uncharacterized protein n=1 Tax=Caerostris extrusa TaxID=172846 RepID=A0AAV4VTF7_CAEEX|nr:hypothetical protein CEXT_657961 [Caerostris extrusa]